MKRITYNYVGLGEYGVRVRNEVGYELDFGTLRTGFLDGKARYFRKGAQLFDGSVQQVKAQVAELAEKLVK